MEREAQRERARVVCEGGGGRRGGRVVLMERAVRLSNSGRGLVSDYKITDGRICEF